jgi:integrase
MGKKSLLSGVQAKGVDRIQFDFEFDGTRYRPTLKRVPSEANLRRAYKQLLEIKQRINNGTFNFGDEFPDYRYKIAYPAASDDSKTPETCNEVFDKFIAYCEHRVSMDDMALSTLNGYREILDRIFRPEIGADAFESIVYTRLADIVALRTAKAKKKTYNNISSAIRTAFKFGYKDRPGKFNPTLALETFRITGKDRPKIEPFTIQEAEAIIAASHQMHGEWYGNYEEFRFFTGLRQSEQFALRLADCDLATRKLSVTKAIVEGREKNRPKTNQDREIHLCRRAIQVLCAQLALRDRMVAAGQIAHNFIFFTAVGEPIQTTYLPYNRWTEVFATLPIRRRKPYNSRHSYISWRLMAGHNRLLVAQEDGHGVEVMERTYAAWIRGAKAAEVARIKAAMASRPADADYTFDEARNHRRRYRNTPPESPKAGTKLAPDADIPCSDRATAGMRIEGARFANRCEIKEKTPRNWLGWLDSNQRMAGSKPDQETSNISKLLIFIRSRSPSTPSNPRSWHQSWHHKRGMPNRKAPPSLPPRTTGPLLYRGRPLSLRPRHCRNANSQSMRR